MICLQMKLALLRCSLGTAPSRLTRSQFWLLLHHQGCWACIFLWQWTHEFRWVRWIEVVIHLLLYFNGNFIYPPCNIHWHCQFCGQHLKAQVVHFGEKCVFVIRKWQVVTTFKLTSGFWVWYTWSSIPQNLGCCQKESKIKWLKSGVLYSVQEMC